MIALKTHIFFSSQIIITLQTLKWHSMKIYLKIILLLNLISYSIVRITPVAYWACSLSQLLIQIIRWWILSDMLCLNNWRLRCLFRSRVWWLSLVWRMRMRLLLNRRTMLWNKFLNVLVLVIYMWNLLKPIIDLSCAVDLTFNLFFLQIYLLILLFIIIM
jgi:hypothetical protein